VTYKPVTLSRGVFIDGTGRETVVTDDVQLNPEDFLGQVTPLPKPPAGQPDYWYPVFVNGFDELGQASSNLTGACGGAQPTRTQETYQISFGLPGSELNLDQQQTVAVADGPGDGTSNPWKVLVGFVQWVGDPTNNFADATVVALVNGTEEGPRYVGVNAAQVTSQSGALLLATHPVGFTGKNPVMAVEIKEADKDGKLVFGKLNPDGSVAEVLSVTSTGDLTVAGKFSGAVTPGSVQVQSGTVFDGMLLPLPIGIDPAGVSAGKLTLNIHVTPRMDEVWRQAPSSSGGKLWVPFPGQCRVDDDTLQVHCNVQWWNLAPAPPAKGPILPVLADYTVIAAVAAAKGSGT
jgi:hypothetical protein